MYTFSYTVKMEAGRSYTMNIKAGRSYTAKMEAGRSPTIWVKSYETALCHIPQGNARCHYYRIEY